MLKGIDVSHWDDFSDVGSLPIDFVIVKSTQGTNFIDSGRMGFYRSIKTHNKLFGFYHFANGDSPESEAAWFYENSIDWMNEGIPILDFEIEVNNPAQWCEQFITKFHELSGKWCVIYVSASLCSLFAYSWIPQKCELWVAGYPKNYHDWPPSEIPYNIRPWSWAAMWQFSSELVINGMQFDGNYAYVEPSQWLDLTKSGNTPQPQPQPVNDYLTPFARDVIAGKYGNGAERKERIFRAVQDRVNELV